MPLEGDRGDEEEVCYMKKNAAFIMVWLNYEQGTMLPLNF